MLGAIQRMAARARIPVLQRRALTLSTAQRFWSLFDSGCRVDEVPPPISWAVQGGPPDLKLHQVLGGDPISASGLEVWPAARTLAEYLLTVEDLEGKRLLELGSGTGAVGLACAAKASRVVLSDRMLPEPPPPSYSLDGSLETFTPSEPADGSGRFHCGGLRGSSRRQLALLEQNLQFNAATLPTVDAHVFELDFRDTSAPSLAVQLHGPFDFIVGSDIAYNREAHPSVVACLARILRLHQQAVDSSSSCGAMPKMLIAQQGRLLGCDASFIAHLHEVGLAATEIHRKGDVYVLLVELKSDAEIA
eukprot:gb/GFBE01025889.1/.p1 GENE.gb/GFBE01025889.1/~~gb/GFBE01025889.1/.p1  ORF type:complete len:305 (+),score=61.82 gb/GFBE01025889.1/:1-915(+)